MRVRSFRWLIKPTAFNITPSSIRTKSAYQIPYTLTPANTTNKKVHRTSSNPSVATVDDTWLITPIVDWNTTITAVTDYLAFTDSVPVEVYVVHTTGVTLNETTIKIAKWKTFQLVATVHPDDTSFPEVQWSSSNTSIATVSQNWLVTCVWAEEWNCTITVTTVDWWYTATCEVIQWRAPGSNTIVYLPLNWETDRYWRYDTGDVVLWSDTAWEDIYQNIEWIRFKWNNNSYIEIKDVPVMNTDFTINFWWLLYNNTQWMMVERWQSDATNRMLHYVIRNTTKVDLGFYSNDCAWVTNTSTWVWYNFTATYNHTTREMKTYINAVLDGTRTWSWDPDFGSWSLYLWWKHSHSQTSTDHANFTMSKFIWEDKIWSATDIQDYIDLTIDDYRDKRENYQEVEYIQSSWTQYIDSWVVLDTNDKMNWLDMYVKATHTWTGNFMWVYNWSTYATMEVPWSYPNRLRCFIWNSSTYTDRDVLHSDNTTYDEVEYIYSSSLATFIINWTTYTQSRSWSYNTGTRPIFIFWRSNSSSYEQLLSMKLSKCYIKIWDTLIRDFVPCYRKTDWEIGIWDTVEWKFYWNSGTWTFTKWPKIWLTLNKNTVTLTEAWQTEQLTVSWNPTTILDWWVNWISSDNSIATVSNTWLVTCITPGECTITVETKDKLYSDVCNIKEISVWTFYYNFKWWSLAWFQAAWWSNIWTNGSYTIDSNWLWQTSSSNDRSVWAFVPVSLTWANKIVFYSVGTYTSASWSNGKHIALSYTNDSERWWQPCLYWEIWFNTSSPATYTFNWIVFNWTEKAASRYANTSWRTTQTMEVDLVTGLVTYTHSWTNVHTYTYTLTASELSSIKTARYVWAWHWRWYSSYNSERLEELWISIYS